MHHQKECVSLTKKYMKTDFSIAIFSDEHRATIDLMAGSAFGLFREEVSQHYLRSSIVCSKILGPFNVIVQRVIVSYFFCDTGMQVNIYIL